MSATLGIRLLAVVVLVVLGVETVAMSIVARRSPRMPPLRTLLPNLAAGACLVFALVGATLDQPLPVVTSCVLLAGIAHGWDLLVRIRHAGD